MWEPTENLKAIRELMLTQDNRSTSYPIFIIVEDKKVYGVAEEYGGERERMEDFDYKDLCTRCLERVRDNREPVEDCDNWQCDKTFVNYRVEEDVPNIRAGFFFTEEQAEHHLKVQRHHYNSTAKTYAISAYHNTELKQVMEFLAGKDLG